MKSLIIAEKPSVARDIARVLKCNKKSEGCLYNEKYIVSWAIGHLVTLFEPEDYSKDLKKWSSSSLPIIPSEIRIKPIKNTFQQFKLLKELINLEEVSELICATDSGREGELIFRYIYDLVNCKKPFKRLWISSMTDEAIKQGFSNLKLGEEYDNLYYSAKCRSEADWLVGINASRAFTLKFNTLLSIGRVQTPTLSILVERFKEIEKFDSRPYFEVEATFNIENVSEGEEETYKGTWIDIKTNETKIFDKEKANKIFKETKGKRGKVFSVEEEMKKYPPPLLYDLTELQRECNKKFGYSAQKTLSIAQDLYEKMKVITYPRTDSRYLSEDIKYLLPKVLGKIKALDTYETYVDYIFSLEKLPISKRIVDNSKISDHHAIIPTNTSFNISRLSLEQKNVFDLIIRRFIAVFYPNYIYNVTKILTKVDDETFISKGNTLIQKGWTELNLITEKEKKKKKLDEIILPKLEKEQLVTVLDLKINNKKTKPPSHYNEATLLSAMENAGRFAENEEIKEQMKDSGLGTPATRASIIEKLIKIGYVQRKGKLLIPTEKGISLMEVIPKELKSPETTGKWEKALNSIYKGNMEKEKFMNSINKYVIFLVNYARSIEKEVVFIDKNYNKKYQSLPKFGKCIKCSEGDILENSKGFYCSNWKGGCKFSIWKDTLKGFGIILNGEIVQNLLKDKKIINFKCTNFKDNSEYLINIYLLENGNIIAQK